VTASLRRARRAAAIAVIVTVGLAGLVGTATPGTAAVPSDPGAPGPFTVTTADYGFGDAAFVPNGFPAPVELRARVYYPRSLDGRFPLVVFLHGRHLTCFDPVTRGIAFEWPCLDGRVPIASHRGYADEATLLASRGYIVASISANAINFFDDLAVDLGANARGQLVLRHLDLWRKWATTGGAPFGSRFAGHVDLGNIGLMGHSRGGEGVVAAAVLNQQLGSPYAIRGVIALAPTDFSRLALTRVPFEVILPYCDGDVSDLQGIHFYDDARYLDATDSAPKHAVLVGGADHNFFNAAWTPPYPGGGDDWFDPSEPACGADAPTTQRLLPADERAVGGILFAAFFRRYLGGERAMDPYLDGSAARPPSLLQIPHAAIAVSYHAPAPRTERRDVARLRSPSNLLVDSLGGAMHYSGFDDVALCGATLPNPSCLGSFFVSDNEPHSTTSFLAPDEQGLSQLRLVWRQPGAKVTFDVPADKADQRRYRALTLRAGVVFTNPLNPVGLSQDVFVRLQDAAGHRAFARVSDFGPALHYPAGAVTSFGSVPKLYDATVRIPLTAFAGVDLRTVRSVALQTGPTATGSITVSDLAFTDPA
jgi:hypothetical protein